jgi:C4-type Zn-finger protein
MPRNTDGLIPYRKGQSGNPNGRPKKYVLSMKTEGYKMTEINDTIQAMVGMNMDELKKVFESDKATILEKTVAAALRKGLQKGELNNIETLLNRLYGKPKEKMDITTNGENITEPKYVINIIKTNIDDEGDKDDTGISRPTG